MDNKPTLEIDDDGVKRWLLNGEYHREDGPAVEWSNGRKEWYLNGNQHREDGPAIEWRNGDKEWWLNDKEYNFDGWLTANTSLSDEDKLMIKLIYG